ncbi:hypothetical protein [Streptomyces erythrochromogenes]|uniref:hypothetical protein n=1 Tax=Streptomyces erythrochromogenes TaxID=285574 RepID=UPI0036FE9D3D
MEKSPALLAGDAAAAVRQLNHALLNTREITPPEISTTVQELLLAVDRIPQALTQLAAHLVRDQRHGRVRMDDGGDSTQPVLEVETHLSDAEFDLNDATAQLRKAVRLLFAMSAPGSTDDQETEQ